MTLTYQDFLYEVGLGQLRQGRNGLRLVGDDTTYPDGTRCLGMLIPHVQWHNNEEWEAAYRLDKVCPGSRLHVHRNALP